MKRLDVNLLPAWMPDDIRNDTAVVIDILRASTTIVHALDAGASEVIPCLETEDALRQRQDDPTVLLGGERGGEPIQGFDLGNSPLEYSAEVVAGRRIAFTTSNGTRALQACADARDVVVGAFSNLSAVVQYLTDAEPQRTDGGETGHGESRGTRETTVRLVCAGTMGKVSREDTLFAGALLARLAKSPNCDLTDAAQLALDAWNGISRAELASAIAEGAGGRNLQRLGRQDDIRYAAQIDTSVRVPRYRNGTLQ